MVLTLNNVREISKFKYPLLDRQIFEPKNKWDKYTVEEELRIQLSNGDILVVEKGFLWDKSSMPKILHWLFAPTGKFEVAALIHDKIYKDLKNKYTRKFADLEMYKWSKALQGTKKCSFRNFDNRFRYIGVRLVGWLAWKDII